MGQTATKKRRSSQASVGARSAGASMGRRNSGGRGLLHLDGEGHASLLIRSRSNNKLRNVYRENTTLTRKKKNLYELDEKITEIILYGSENSGKTTICQQLDIIQGRRLERTQYRVPILYLLLKGAYYKCKIIISEYQKLEQTNVSRSNMKKNSEKVKEMPKFYSITRDVYHAFKSLSENKVFQDMLKQDSRYSLPTNWEYFLNCLVNSPGYPIWGGPSWFPSQDDILFSNVNCNEKYIVNFKYDGINFNLIDYGTLNFSKRQFEQTFPKYDALAFVASLTEYSETDSKILTRNKLKETLKLWSKLVNDKKLEGSFFLLILNKFDLFQQKFYHQKQAINFSFKKEQDEELLHLKGKITKPPKPQDEENKKCEKSLEWFEKLFLSCVGKDFKHKVRVYVTNALDKGKLGTTIQLSASIIKHHSVNM